MKGEFLSFDEQPLSYKLVRSDRHSLSMEITREGGVLVRAPHRCPQAEIDRFIAKHRDWLSAHIEKHNSRANALPEPTEEERLALIALAKEWLPSRVNHFSAIMGLVPGGISITGAKTRFGSCSSKNRLCFSWRLMRYPDVAIDYVVVHELAHIAHKNHSRELYSLISSVLPDYKERIKLLRG